ncbi:MAG: hypothetical protein PHT00_05600 [Candidatus Methanomethylophilus sp.]|nr:hypothetical protein [Methanomethylophilus sp.]MDD4222425.1 hypothetical protein [Methanomethylophilus sp.]MDD4669042.1 hypothetical protein [Methanomethylophilus sp.]
MARIEIAMAIDFFVHYFTSDDYAVRANRLLLMLWRKLDESAI